MKRLNKIFVFGCILIILINLFPLTSLAGKSCNHSVTSLAGRHDYCMNCGISIHWDIDGDDRCDCSWTTTTPNGYSTTYHCNERTKKIQLQTSPVAGSFDALRNENEYAVGCTPGGTYNSVIEQRVFQYYQGTHDDYGGPTKYSNAKQEYFKCDVSGLANAADYQEIMVPYYTVESFYYETYPGFWKITPTYVSEETIIMKHTTIFVNTKQFPLSLEDVHIDIDGGRLVVSGTINDDTDAWNQIFDSISGIIVGITGLGTLCCLLAMVIQIIKLGAAAANPMDREKALKGVLWTGIGTAGCGAAALIFGLAYNIL